MPFSYSGAIASPSPPIEFDSGATANPQIPPSAIGFTYVLCGGGGGGGNGGVAIGGGGGGSGEFVCGTIVLSELAETIGCTVQQILLSVDIGNAGTPSDRGGDSSLVANSAIISIAKGGFGGLNGSNSIGYGHGELGTTYTAIGGIGERAIRNEAKSTIDRSIVDLNHYGDGGDGGAAGLPGQSGKQGYFSIDFF